MTFILYENAFSCAYFSELFLYCTVFVLVDNGLCVTDNCVWSVQGFRLPSDSAFGTRYRKWPWKRSDLCWAMCQAAALQGGQFCATIRNMFSVWLRGGTWHYRWHGKGLYIHIKGGLRRWKQAGEFRNIDFSLGVDYTLM